MDNSRFVKVTIDTNKAIIVKKSSLYWLLDENHGKVSVDRLKRFVVNKSSTERTTTKRKLRKTNTKRKKKKKQKL